MIISAKDLNMEHSREEIINCFCDSLMEKIKQKAANGNRITSFDSSIWYYSPTKEITIKPDYEKWTEQDKWDCYKYSFSDYKDEIKKRFEKAGYIIKPTGYIGGVYQRTEDIMW